MDKFGRLSRSVKRSVKRRLGVQSDNSDNSDNSEFEYVTGRRRKRPARSPSPGAQARSNADTQAIIAERYLEEKRRADEIASNRLQQEAADSEYENNINTMIGQINGKELFGIPYVSLDYYDPDTRYVIGMVVRTHGMTQKSLDLLQRSPVLFRILQDRIRRSRIGRVLCAVGSTAAECARFLSSGLSRVASVASGVSERQVKRPARSPSPPGELVYLPLEPHPNREPEQPASGQYAPGRSAASSQRAPGHLRARRRSPDMRLAPVQHALIRPDIGPRELSVARQSTFNQVGLDALLARQLAQNIHQQMAELHEYNSSAQNHASAAPASAAPFSAPAPAAPFSAPPPASAPPPPPPPPPPPARALDVVEDICAICFLGPDEDRGPLGYVAVHNPPLDRGRYKDTGHPDRFHEACLQSCPGNKCPMCRATPVWGLERQQPQGGGGSKKYRSKSRSRSKSKSKTRRLRKSRNKSRKSCKSRKPRSSSRRK